MKLPALWTMFGQDHVPYQLLLLAKMIDREAARQMQAEFGLSLADWRVLAYIGVTGPASASTIGNKGHIDRAEISRAVSRLIDSGLVTRTPSEENRRRLIIEATPQGKEVFLKIRDQRRAYYQSIMVGIPPEDLSRVSAALESMALRVNALLNNPAEDAYTE